MMGDGFFIAPADGHVVAPCDAEVMFVFDTKHAIGMKAADGTEFLIHFGVDTVKLGGQGFEVFVEQGQQVKQGDKLMEVDLDYVKANAPSDVCLVIFTGGQAVHMEKSYGIKALDAVASY
jgi:PTS system D-glucosamine-specific IIC component